MRKLLALVASTMALAACSETTAPEMRTDDVTAKASQPSPKAALTAASGVSLGTRSGRIAVN